MKNNGLFNILLVIAVTLAILYSIQYLTGYQAISNQGNVVVGEGSDPQEPGQSGGDVAKTNGENQGRETLTGYRAGDMHPGPYPNSETGFGDGKLESTQAGCPPDRNLSPNDLLPQDEASAWAKLHPTGTGSLKDKNYLQAGHHIGIDTVGQTLRNANLQLHSEPPNPRLMVSPWLNSTIEADTNRRPFELGSC